MRAGAIPLAALLALAALPRPAAGEPWYAAYERGQVALVEGRPAEAESAFRGALAARPEPGCRLRTYGVRVRDYAPWYYLGVALEEQGRRDEALAAQERSLEAGLLARCPGLSAQAADQVDRLARLGRGGSAEPRAPLERLREQALAAGAEELAPRLVARARGLESSCAPPCPEASAAWLEALSRARIAAPLHRLLLAEVQDAWRELRGASFLIRADGGELGPSEIQALDSRVAHLAPRGADVPELLRVLRELEGLRLPGAPAPERRVDSEPAAASQPDACAAARRTLALLAGGDSSDEAGRSRVRALLEEGTEGSCRDALFLAESLRAAAARAPAEGSEDVGRVVVELYWSEQARGLPRAFLGAGP